METLANLANQGQIAKLIPTKVKSPSKISAFKRICYLQNKVSYTYLVDSNFQHNYNLGRFSMSAFRQRLFRQNSLNQDSPKFFLTKVSSFTVIQIRYNRMDSPLYFLRAFHKYALSNHVRLLL